MSVKKALYDLTVRAVDITTPWLALLPGKTGEFFRERKDWKKTLARTPIKPGGIWIHAASAGEYEQAKPVMEKLKEKYPDRPLILTFFSPSGYRFAQNKTPADYVLYLPLDTRKNATYFLEKTNISAALFIKYEFWPNFLHTLHQKKIPTFLVSGIFRENQSVFRQSFLKKSLSAFTAFFVQDEKSAKLLQTYGFKNVHVTGDTRFDTVFKLLDHKSELPVISDFKGNSKLLTAGSTWPPDENALLNFITNPAARDWKLLIIPHEPTPKHINALLKKSPVKTALYSTYGSGDRDARILIADVMGLLKFAYRYTEAAYVGGGFGKGIHNILEAAVYGVPVIFGPKYRKFNEAIELLKLGGGFSINSENELKSLILNDLTDDKLVQAGRIAADFVRNRTGASEKIVNILEKYLN